IAAGGPVAEWLRRSHARSSSLVQFQAGPPVSRSLPPLAGCWLGLAERMFVSLPDGLPISLAARFDRLSAGATAVLIGRRRRGAGAPVAPAEFHVRFVGGNPALAIQRRADGMR